MNYFEGGSNSELVKERLSLVEEAFLFLLLLLLDWGLNRGLEPSCLM